MLEINKLNSSGQRHYHDSINDRDEVRFLTRWINGLISAIKSPRFNRFKVKTRPSTSLLSAVIADFGESAPGSLNDMVGRPISTFHTIFGGLALYQTGQEPTNKGVTGPVGVQNVLGFDGHHREGGNAVTW